MLKNFIARLTSMKTTVIAVITSLLTVGVAAGVISSDALTEGIAATGNVYEAVIVLLGGVSSIILLFSKDDGVAV